MTEKDIQKLIEELKKPKEEQRLHVPEGGLLGGFNQNNNTDETNDNKSDNEKNDNKSSNKTANSIIICACCFVALVAIIIFIIYLTQRSKKNNNGRPNITIQNLKAGKEKN